MKIADVSEFYSPTGGGVRIYVNQKLEAAAAHGHDVTVIAPGSEDRIEERAGGRIAWVKSPAQDRNYRMFWHAQDVWRVLDRIAPDIVEGSSPWRGGWLAGTWPGRARKILVMHADPVAIYPQNLLGRRLGRDRTDRLFGWFWWYLRRLNARFDATIVAGDWLNDRFSRFGLKRMTTVPLGVERAIFRSGRRDLALRREMLAACGLGEDAALLIAVGRHHPEKRLGLLIAAVKRAQRQREIGFYIAGDGIMRRAVEARARSVPHIHVGGRVDDREKLAGMMASADALLHGSSSETYGLAVAEALCLGTPIIVPDQGGAADHAEAGFAETYHAGDGADAGRAILALLARDHAQLSNAALAASDRRIIDAQEHFTRLFALYQEWLRNPSL